MEAERVVKAGPSVEVHASPAPGFGIDIHRFRYAGHAYQDANAGLSCHAIFVQFSGPVAVTLWMAGRSLEHVPSAGTFGIAPAGMDSGVLVRGAIAGVILRIASECLALASAELGRHRSTLLERWAGRDAKLLSLSRSLDREAVSGRREGPLYWSGLADALIGHLATRHMSESAPARTASMSAQDLRRVDDFIRANLATPLDLATIAASVGHDRFRFAREFRAAVGVTPHRYVTRLRLQRARVLLCDRGLSLAEVAGLAGFYDQSHMTNWFRRVYGITPSMAAACGMTFHRASSWR